MAQSAASFGARGKNYLGKKFYLGSYFWCKRPQVCHAVPAKCPEERRCVIATPCPRYHPGSEIEHSLNTAQPAGGGISPNSKAVEDVGENMGLD